MIIVNQNKNIIINFTNVISIYVQENNVQVLMENIEDALILGKYKTEARAKEVLKRIVLAHSNFQLTKNIDGALKEVAIPMIATKYEYFDTYEMPAE